MQKVRWCERCGQEIATSGRCFACGHRFGSLLLPESQRGDDGEVPQPQKKQTGLPPAHAQVEEPPASTWPLPDNDAPERHRDGAGKRTEARPVPISAPTKRKTKQDKWTYVDEQRVEGHVGVPGGVTRISPATGDGSGCDPSREKPGGPKSVAAARRTRALLSPRAWKCIITLGIVAVLALVGSIVSTGQSSGMSASVTEVAPLSHQTAEVWVRWTNGGSSPNGANYVCEATVTVTDGSGNQLGEGYASVSPNRNVPAGQSATYKYSVTISNNSASGATDPSGASISDCSN